MEVVHVAMSVTLKMMKMDRIYKIYRIRRKKINPVNLVNLAHFLRSIHAALRRCGNNEKAASYVP
jgi:hypothetical protein